MARAARILAATLVIATTCGRPAAHAAEKRVALVIGNAKYGSKPLGNPVNDANDMASAPSELGFRIVKATDPGPTGYAHAATRDRPVEVRVRNSTTPREERVVISVGGPA